MSRLELVSIHIPKTGGTSFFEAVRTHYGDSLIVDHDHIPGTGVDITAPATLPPGACAVHGHFRADRYRHFIHAFHVTFLRDPVEQFISNYYFWLTLPPSGVELHERLLAERPDILTYAKHYTNGLLPAYFQGVDLHSLDYVGFTDRRLRDYRALSRILGFQIDPAIHENVTPLPPDLEAERREVMEDGRVLGELRATLRDDYHYYDLFRTHWA